MPSGQIFGLIGGSGLLKSSLPLLQGLTEEIVATAHGSVFLRSGTLPCGAGLVFVQRHDARASRTYTQPADINYAAIALALQAKVRCAVVLSPRLRAAGCPRSLLVVLFTTFTSRPPSLSPLQQHCSFVLAICSVGGLKMSHGVGTLLVCDDFWCPFDLRRVYEDARAHVLPTFSEPLRAAVLDVVRATGEHPLPTGVYANARGPRFETKAEIRMMGDYCDVVGMTGAHEASSCCELGLPYAMLAMVDNYANGVGSDVLSLEAFHAAQAKNLSRLEICVDALLKQLPAAALSVAPPPPPSPTASQAAAAAADSSASMDSTPVSMAAGTATPTPQAVDLIVHARWVVCVASGRESHAYDRHAVVVCNGRIVDILPSDEAGRAYRATRVSTLGSHSVLIPGLVNAHTHLSMSLMKGLADDLPLLEWLQTAIWPAEGRLVGEAFVRAGTRAAAAELVRGGVTCVNDMYFFPEVAAAVLDEVGLRGLVAGPILEFPSAYAGGPDEYLAKARMLHAARESAPRVRASLGPHAPYTVSDATFSKVAAASAQTGMRVHVHLHETAGEVEASVSGGTSGAAHSKHLSPELMSPLDNLSRLGLVNEQLVAVHMTSLTDKDIALLAASRANVVHCPSSNMKLASGFSPVAKLLAAGVNVAIGTDSSASNNSLDMFAEMKMTALLAKGVAGDARVVPAWQALRMATLGGATALGLGSVTGSLEVGKAFDAAAIDLGHVESMPCFDVISHLVYSTGRSAVTDVWVDGVALLAARSLMTIDEAATKADISAWAQKVKEKGTATDSDRRIDDKFRAHHGCCFR